MIGKVYRRFVGNANTMRSLSQLSPQDIIRKCRFRWTIENGIKDLVASYYWDEILGLNPKKVEFEFYCVSDNYAINGIQI
jgi:hypothetical protein